MKINIKYAVIILFAVFALKSCGGCIDQDVTVTGNDANLVDINVKAMDLGKLAPEGETKLINVNFSGTLVKKVGDKEGNNNFDRSRSYEATRGDNSAASLSRRNLTPGEWDLTAAAEGWSATCRVTLASGQGNVFTFTHGKTGCAN